MRSEPAVSQTISLLKPAERPQSQLLLRLREQLRVGLDAITAAFSAAGDHAAARSSRVGPGSASQRVRAQRLSVRATSVDDETGGCVPRRHDRLSETVGSRDPTRPGVATGRGTAPVIDRRQ